jgi:hypothetical protein
VGILIRRVVIRKRFVIEFASFVERESLSISNLNSKRSESKAKQSEAKQSESESEASRSEALTKSPRVLLGRTRASRGS